MKQTTRWKGVALALLLCAGAVFAAGPVPAQAQDSAVTWFMNYGVNADPGYSYPRIISMPDGGHIMAATVSTADRGLDGLIIKIDRLGGVQWQAAYGGSGHDYLHSISRTPDGGFIAGGESSSFGPSGETDGWVFKLDSAGNLEWQRTVGSVYRDRVNFITPTADGGSIAAFQTFYPYAFVQYLVKFDAAGGVEWQRSYGQNKTYGAHTVLQTADGGYLVEGRTYISTGYHVMLLKVDALGVPQWEKYYLARTDFAETHVIATNDGGFAIAVDSGFRYEGTVDIWFAKLDSEGAIQWQKGYGAGGYDVPKALTQTADGGFAIFGVNQVLKIDAAGAVQWYKAYTGPGEIVLYDVADAPNGAVAAAGALYSGGRVSLAAMTFDGNGAIDGCPAGMFVDHPGIAFDVNVGLLTSYYPLWPGGAAFTVTESTATRAAGAAAAAAPICQAFAPAASIDPLALDFGMVELGTAAVRTVTIANTGTADLAVGPLAVNGPGAAAFALAGSCSLVPPGGSCAVTVTFTPAALGRAEATLAVPTNDPAVPAAAVALAGTGVDTTASTLEVSATPAVLWPPNHRLVDVTVTGTAADAGSGIASVTVTVADEYGAEIPPAFSLPATFKLEASRHGDDLDGRTYLITVTATDLAGNTTTRTVTVLVTHDQGT